MIDYEAKSLVNKRSYAKHRDDILAKKRSVHARLKLRVLSHYGGCCAVCGITDPGLLTIDHVNNDGAKHRKTISRGTGFYRWFVKNNFPPGFQVLCWNHNCVKQIDLIKSDDKSALRRLNLKRNVINQYGGKCEFCGETEISFLTIDHINGGGNQQRKLTGCGSGYRFCRWLRDNGFPPGFRILCFNCNCGKSVSTTKEEIYA